MVSISKKASLANKSKSSKKHKPPKKSLIETHVMTLAETAKYLKISKKLLEEQVRLGSVPGRNIGGEWRFSKAALEDWLANHPSSQNNILAFAGAFAHDETFLELLEIIEANRKLFDAQLRK
jgi:excisionase family DNA binding protein